MNFFIIIAILLLPFNFVFGVNQNSNFEQEIIGGIPNLIIKDDRDWNFSLGIAGGYGNSFIGSKKKSFQPTPFMALQYKDVVQLSLGELKVIALSTNGFQAGLVSGLDLGRKESIDRKMLEGIDDVPATGSAGGFIQYANKGFIGYADLRYVFGGGINSISSITSLTYLYAISSKMVIGGGGVISFAGNQLMQALFGVNEAESNRTGLAVYQPSKKGSFVVATTSLIALTSYQISNSFSVNGNINYFFLGSKASNSSLIKERGEGKGFAISIGAEYKF